jgi:hypothetical protein
MTDRERCYPILRKLRDAGWIDRYIAAQHPISKRWGFMIATTAETPDSERYFFLPREAIAFAEGIKVAEAKIERVRDRYGDGTPGRAALDATLGTDER